jgi:hypothetical protein
VGSGFLIQNVNELTVIHMWGEGKNAFFCTFLVRKVYIFERGERG